MSCPECEKKIRVPEENIGKKVRCPACSAVFAIKAPKTAASAAAPAKPKPAPASPPPPPPPAHTDDDEDNDANPYGVTSEDLTPRCPHCAKELDSENAVICLHCGYNLRSRVRTEQKAVYAPTAGDYFLHLLPGIICVLVIIGLIVLDVICYRNMENWLDGSFLGNKARTPGEKDEWIVRPSMFTLYIVLATGFASYKLGMFAFRRLVLNNRPPEVILRSE
ncbi:zinc-ribbon domain-containing protein [Tuwongella immobilis]|uniref:zinc-ribbon domain-containing protein n=1 Tax=Tuwongella immobilis TaxID=692036 RepID=UPI001E3D2A5D|nr:zinc-ribbon domain-containing protein [Tuwongella immobilis]